MRFAALLFALSIPLIAAISYQAADHSFPRSDEGYYAAASLELANTSRTTGLAATFKEAFSHRTSATALPALAFPFFLIEPEHPRISLAVASVTVFAVFLVYAFFFVRAVVGTLPAVLSVWVLGLFPVFQHNAHRFNWEGWFFACGMAALFHLFRSEGLRRVWHVLGFALFMSLAVLLRLPETLMYLCPLVLLYMWGQYKQRKVQEQALHWILAPPVCLALLALYLNYGLSHPFVPGAPGFWWVYVLVAAAIVLVYGMAALKRKVPSLLALAFAPPLLAAYLWYFSDLAGSFYYFYSCSFDPATFGLRPSTVDLLAPTRVWHRLSELLDPALLVYAGIIVLLSVLDFYSKRNRTVACGERVVATKLVVLALLPFVLGLFSQSSDLRYFYPSVLMLMAALLCLLKALSHAKLRALALLLTILFAFVLAQFSYVTQQGRLDQSMTGSILRWPVHRHPGWLVPLRTPDPALVLLQAIKNLRPASEGRSLLQLMLVPAERPEPSLDLDANAYFLRKALKMPEQVSVFSELKALADKAKPGDVLVAGPFENKTPYAELRKAFRQRYALSQRAVVVTWGDGSQSEYLLAVAN